MGEQWVPDEIGTETGPPHPPRAGHPRPREIKSQKAQYDSGHRPGRNKGVKLEIIDKVRGRD